MSIRLRLTIMCLVVGLLPAIPLSLLVEALIEKSFNVGLSGTVSDALESGVSVSRTCLAGLQEGFERDAAAFAGSLAETPGMSATAGCPVPDSVCIAAVAARFGDIGFYVPASSAPRQKIENPDSTLPPALSFLSGDDEFASITGGGRLAAKRGGEGAPRAGDEGGAGAGIVFFESEDRTCRVALATLPGGGRLVIYRKTPTAFIADAERILEGRRMFARLDLSRNRLGRSFFYPFVFIYIVVVAFSLCIAFLLAERLAAPMRRLEKAASSVASGDWSVRLEGKFDGETGRLVAGFNRMVAHLDEQNRRLVDMEKMTLWREMARHLAHEIKNPLLPIRLAVQEMKDQYRGGDAKYADFLADSARVVEEELGSLGNLVREFSSFARMPGISMTRQSIAGLAGDVALLYAHADVRVNADPAIPESYFDREAMKRVFVNLFDNSLAAAPEGSKSRITISIETDGESAVIRFGDDGPGIPRGDIAKIFDPYFTTKKEGTGLGLAVVKNIVLLHGGTIAVDCPAGGGTIFTLRIPLASGPPPTQTAETPDARSNGDMSASKE